MFDVRVSHVVTDKKAGVGAMEVWHERDDVRIAMAQERLMRERPLRLPHLALDPPETHARRMTTASASPVRRVWTKPVERRGAVQLHPAA